MRTPPLPYGDLLRLEVETTPDGLPNLVQNPSGDLGGWGWITPVPGSYMYQGSNGGNTIAYRHPNSAGVAGYFTTELLPAAAGTYYAARADVAGVTVGHNVKASFEWYDATKTLLSTTAQTTAWTTGTNYRTALIAPASTAYVKLRLDFYSGTSTPAAFSFIDLRNVMVTYAATSGALQSVRTNLVTNPSMETNIAGYTGANATLARDTTLAWSGSASLKVTCIDGTAGFADAYTASGTAGFAVTGGATYTVQMRARAASTARGVFIRVYWYTSAGAYLLDQDTPIVFDTNTGWTRVSGTMTAPSAAAFAMLDLNVISPAAGEAHYFDAVLLEKSLTLRAYFDGSTAPVSGKAYSWTGTAHASTSKEISSDYDFNDPTTWRDILGPTHDISIERRALDVGTLAATIYDAALDPATASEIRPGKRLRLRAAHASFSDGWESVYDGKISAAKATYLRQEDGTEKVRVEISAVDNIAALANQGELRGVPTIAALPYILEGKAVPWSVNGSGNQVASATIVSNNDSASVLDQVAVVRDTALGQAYVDRNGVLTVRTAPTTVTDGFTDVAADYAAGKFSYSDIEIDFSTDNLINEVTVLWLRYNAATGETTEITYGPYRDQASINTWGVRSATFTIQGTAESGSSIASYAQTILTANAQPVVRPRSLTMPVKRTADLVPATRYDLGHKVPVVRTGRINASYIVQGITHTITPELWAVTYYFDPDGAVASPTMTPSPPDDAQIVNYALATSVVTASTGWSVTAGQFYRQGRVVHGRMSFTRTGAAVTLTTPDHADQQLGVINDPAWRPVQSVSAASYEGGPRSVHATASGTVWTSSGLSAGSYTNSTINTNDVISVGFTYLLPEGV